jgi:polyisoprenoid-binding protein YceI
VSTTVRYRIDPAVSRFELEARTTLLPIHAGATGIEGYVDVPLDADGRVDDGGRAGGRMTFEIRRLEEANPVYAREIEHLLDSRRHPTVVLDLVSAEPRPGGGYRATGLLTVRGVARPLDGELEVTFPEPGVLRLHGTRTVDVRRFGVDPPNLVLWRVHPDVTVRLEVEARRG